jgi:enoyl-CoA hydratase/carnithine racemase
MADEPVLLIDRRGPAAVVTLNRPHRMNAFNRALADALAGALAELQTDNDVRGIVLTGAGDRAFSAGADLKERATMPESEVRTFVAGLQSTMSTVERMPKPILAAINGYALGGGLELALACDLRYATPTATLALTEVRLGIIPGAGGTQRLPRVVGPARARELIYTGRRINGTEAERIGLVNEVVSADHLVERCVEVIDEIALGAPLAIAQAKFAIGYGTDVDLATGMAIERKAYEVLIPTEDRMEALRAFVTKDKPNFKGR